MPVFAVIGAVTGIASGIYAATQADSQNRQAKITTKNKKSSSNE